MSSAHTKTGAAGIPALRCAAVAAATEQTGVDVKGARVPAAAGGVEDTAVGGTASEPPGPAGTNTVAPAELAVAHAHALHLVHVDHRAWTTREIAILRQSYPKGGAALAGRLLPKRSKSAIYSMAGNLGLKTGRTPAAAASSRRFMTLGEVAGGMGVSERTALSWIGRRGLKASLRDGIQCIAPSVMKRWLRDNPACLDLGRVDKAWLLDVLLNFRGKSRP